METRCFQVATDGCFVTLVYGKNRYLFSVWHRGILPAKHCLNLACLFVFLSVELTLPSEIILESRSAGWIVRHAAKSCQPPDLKAALSTELYQKSATFRASHFVKSNEK